MSLLLEALKKAEKAKEEAQRRAKGESATSELRIENEPQVPEKPVLTRAELPDIRQPLEILSDEIAPRRPRRRRLRRRTNRRLRTAPPRARSSKPSSRSRTRGCSSTLPLHRSA